MDYRICELRVGCGSKRKGPVQVKICYTHELGKPTQSACCATRGIKINDCGLCGRNRYRNLRRRTR